MELAAKHVKDTHYSTTIRIRPSLPARHSGCRIRHFGDSTREFWQTVWRFDMRIQVNFKFLNLCEKFKKYEILLWQWVEIILLGIVHYLCVSISLCRLILNMIEYIHTISITQHSVSPDELIKYINTPTAKAFLSTYREYLGFEKIWISVIQTLKLSNQDNYDSTQPSIPDTFNDLTPRFDPFFCRIVGVLTVVLRLLIGFSRLQWT